MLRLKLIDVVAPGYRYVQQWTGFWLAEVMVGIKPLSHGDIDLGQLWFGDITWSKVD